MKIIIKVYTIVALLCNHSIVTAQQLSIETISVAGVSSDNSQLQLEYSVGGFTSTSLNAGNTILSQGFLQPYFQLQSPLPVLSLEFNAKRINNSKVQLDWKTVQEIDNNGFFVERKKDNEVNFTQLHFVKSAAPNGNSSLPLNYSHVDANDFRGKTYYRLKQEDLDGKFMYSTVKLVNGSNGKSISLKAWPIPSTGPVNISAEGIESDMLLVFDNNGRLMKQVNITGKTPVQINGLMPGTYIVKLSSQKELYQKIVVQ